VADLLYGSGLRLLEAPRRRAAGFGPPNRAHPDATQTGSRTRRRLG
jgi:hypothetical protein